jgi:hypothetical protein
MTPARCHAITTRETPEIAPDFCGFRLSRELGALFRLQASRQADSWV